LGKRKVNVSDRKIGQESIALVIDCVVDNEASFFIHYETKEKIYHV